MSIPPTIPGPAAPGVPPVHPSGAADTPAADGPPLVDRVLAPFRQFAATQSAGGVVLLTAAVIAIAWANSPWAHAYHELWETPLAGTVGGWRVSTTLHHLINDGLMAVFFFVVGLEIKREVLAGELTSLRQAALPMLAALGGMVVPAAVYALVNRGGPGADGWGVPMATDIAFALGVLALLGDRVPVGLKVFLAALAIVDDIGAVLVIAVFYSGGVHWGALGTSAALLVLAAAANRSGVRRPWAYGAIGLALWAAILLSGVHATVAGVLLAFTIPVRTRVSGRQFLSGARRALEAFEAAAHATATRPSVKVLSNSEHHRAVEELEALCEAVQPPLIRLEHALHAVVSFAIIPLFALANAGVTLGADALRSGLADPVAVGAALGLLVGKPVGIAGFSWLTVRLGWGALPRGASWMAMFGVSMLGGIGFTMALFVAGLAFPGEAGAPLLEEAKLGVLAASAVAGVVGGLLLRRTRARPVPPVDAAAAAGAH